MWRAVCFIDKRPRVAPSQRLCAYECACMCVCGSTFWHMGVAHSSVVKVTYHLLTSDRQNMFSVWSVEFIPFKC